MTEAYYRRLSTIGTMNLHHSWTLKIMAIMILTTTLHHTGLKAFSAEWSAESQLAMRGEYNDNLLLTTLPHDPVYGAWVSPDIQASVLREDFELRGNGHWDFVEYIDNPGLDITQQFYDVTVLYRNERSEWSVNGVYTRDSVLQTELEQTGVTGELGAVGKRGIRKLTAFQPAWTIIVTERILALASYTYSDVSFDTPVGSGFSDFDNHAGVLGFTYQPFERTEVRGTGQYSNFHSPAASNRTITYGGELQVSHALSETFNVSAVGGLRLVSSKFPALTPSFQLTTVENEDLVTVFGGTLQKEFERVSVRTEGSRRITSSGIGRLNETDRASFSATYRFTEHMSVSLFGEISQTESLSQQNVQIPEATYYQIRPSVSWQFWEDVRFTANFSHRAIERESTTGPDTTAHSNAVTFSFTYEFPRLATSE